MPLAYDDSSRAPKRKLKPKTPPPVKVYVKPEARRSIQATQATRFINQQVGRKVVKLTAKKKKAQVVITRGLNEGGGGYTFGQPKNAKQVLRGKPTRIKIDPRKNANSAAGWEGSKPVRKRTSQKYFRETGKLGGHISKKHPNFSPTIAQTTAHEITHALGLTHRMGYKISENAKGKRTYRKKAKQPGPHIMNWSSSEMSQSEIRSVRRKTNPKNIGKPGIPKRVVRKKKY